MSSFFERFRGRREPTSAQIAKERLKLVLVADRSNLSPDKLSEMQAEILQVIKRYIPIDDLDVQIKFEQRDRKQYLVADIPLQRDDHLYQTAPSLPDVPPDSGEAGPGSDADTTPQSPSQAV